MGAFTDAAAAAQKLADKLNGVDGLQVKATADKATADASAAAVTQANSDIATEISDLDAKLKAAGLTQ